MPNSKKPSASLNNQDINTLLVAIKEINASINNSIAELKFDTLESMFDQRHQLLSQVFQFPEWGKNAEVVSTLKFIQAENLSQREIVETERDKIKNTLSSINRLKTYLR